MGRGNSTSDKKKMPQKNIVRLDAVYLVKEQKIKFKERKETKSEVYHLKVGDDYHFNCHYLCHYHLDKLDHRK